MTSLGAKNRASHLVPVNWGGEQPGCLHPDLPGSTEEATQAPAGLFPSWPVSLLEKWDSCPHFSSHPLPPNTHTTRELTGLLSRGFGLGIPPKNEWPTPVRFQCEPPSATHRTFGPLGSSRDKGEGAGERGGRESDKVRRTLSKVVDIDSRSLESTQVYTYVRTLQIVHSNISVIPCQIPQ